MGRVRSTEYSALRTEDGGLEVRGRKSEVRGPVVGGRGCCVCGGRASQSRMSFFLGKDRLLGANGMRGGKGAHGNEEVNDPPSRKRSVVGGRGCCVCGWSR